MSKIQHVMMIDDDEVNNFICRRVLDKFDPEAKLSVFLTAKDALDQLQADTASENTPDLVFLDLNMPIMNGWEFLKNFEPLARERGMKPTIIVFSSSVFPDDIRRAEEHALVAAYKYKPITFDLFKEIEQEFFS